ncbi:hypothetical protein ACFV7Q_11425 [Streptomyces sp. NPDC059851]|uniref:hypothetical protein n=1 Tax=Streptomyces sp. NPDC059851 TaxID=3346971 RepID=UPI0036479AC7
MTPCSPRSPRFPRFPTRGRTAPGGAARAVASVASVAVLAAFAAGCRDDTAPPWGYPDLGTTLATLSRVLEEGCDESTPESCVDDLDRLGALADRAFGQVLEHRLLDAPAPAHGGGYVDAVNAVHRARGLRIAAAADARARRDPHHPPFKRAVAAERLAYARLLAALERVRTAPPPGDGTQPV